MNQMPSSFSRAVASSTTGFHILTFTPFSPSPASTWVLFPKPEYAHITPSSAWDPLMLPERLGIRHGILGKVFRTCPEASSGLLSSSSEYFLSVPQYLSTKPGAFHHRALHSHSSAWKTPSFTTSRCLPSPPGTGPQRIRHLPLWYYHRCHWIFSMWLVWVCAHLLSGVCSHGLWSPRDHGLYLPFCPVPPST